MIFVHNFVHNCTCQLLHVLLHVTSCFLIWVGITSMFLCLLVVWSVNQSVGPLLLTNPKTSVEVKVKS